MITYYTNRKRLLVFAFKIDDIIILNNRNIRTIRLNKSLNYKNLELYRIVRVINNIIYELKLFDELNIYLIFYL